MSTHVTDLMLVWGVRIASAAAVLIIGIWLAFFLSKFAKVQAQKNPRIDTTLGTFLARAIRYAIIAIVLVVVLQMFGVQTASLVAILGASALAIGLALQGTLSNVASGIMIALIRPYHIGDFVELNGKEGTVTDLDLFFTEIRTAENRRVLIPNGQAISNPITNFTTSGNRCCVLPFGIGYEDDIDKALGVLESVMLGDPRALTNLEPWFGVVSLGDFAVNLSARVWVKKADHKRYRSDMLKLVKEAFDREGIELPYPHSVEISKGEIELRSPTIKPSPR
jgi:small conductance mechanosensitive channel